MFMTTGVYVFSEARVCNTAKRPYFIIKIFLYEKVISTFDTLMERPPTIVMIQITVT